jgi:hypothetical protein
MRRRAATAAAESATANDAELVALGKQPQVPAKKRATATAAHNEEEDNDDDDEEGTASSSNGTTTQPKQTTAAATTHSAMASTGDIVAHAAAEIARAQQQQQQQPSQSSPSASTQRTGQVDEYEGAAGIVAGALDVLGASAAAPDASVFLGLAVLGREHPALFAHPSLVATLAHWLRPDGTRTTRKNNAVPLLACTLAMAGYATADDGDNDEEEDVGVEDDDDEEDTRWPVEFAIALIEDTLGEKAWAEDEMAAGFVHELLVRISNGRRITTTKKKKTTMEGKGKQQDEEGEEEEEEDLETGSIHTDQQRPAKTVMTTTTTRTRTRRRRRRRRKGFGVEAMASIRAIIVPALREFLQRRSGTPSRGAVKLLVAALVFPEVRQVAATHVEEWVSGPANLRTAKEVLARLVELCNDSDGDDDGDTATAPEDEVVLASLVQTKAKGPGLQFILDALEAMLMRPGRVTSRSTTLSIAALRRFVVHEMLPSVKANGAPFNAKVLTTIWKTVAKPEVRLAEVMRELAFREPAMQLCVMLKRVIRMFGAELDVAAICRGLLEVPAELTASMMMTMQYVTAISELVNTVVLANIPPLDISAPHTSQAVVDAALGFAFFASGVQRDAMVWCLEVLPAAAAATTTVTTTMTTTTHPDESGMALTVVRRLMLLDAPGFISAPDVLGEQERRAASVVLGEQSAGGLPLSEEAVAGVLLLALQKRVLAPGAALGVLMSVGIRAARFRSSTTAQRLQGRRVLTISNGKVAEAVLQLGVLVNRRGEALAGFANAGELWRACVVLVVLGAVDAETFGAHVWRTIPTVRALMEMALTRQWRFPALLPAGISQADLDRKLDQLDHEDQQLSAGLLSSLAVDDGGGDGEEEGHGGEGDDGYKKPMVAAAAVVPFYMTQNARRPPGAVISMLQSIDRQTELGAMLMQCREPRFFDEVISGQDVGHLVAWLAPLVHADRGMIGVLPAETVCELVLATMTMTHGRGGQATAAAAADLRVHQEDMMARLRGEVMAATADPQGRRQGGDDVLQFFGKRLGSERASMRAQARDALARILGQEPGVPWLRSLGGLRWVHSREVGDVFARVLGSETSGEFLAQVLEFLVELRDVFPITATAWALSRLLLERPLVAEGFLALPHGVSVAVSVLAAVMMSAPTAVECGGDGGDDDRCGATLTSVNVTISGEKDLSRRVFPSAFVMAFLEILCLTTPQSIAAAAEQVSALVTLLFPPQQLVVIGDGGGGGDGSGGTNQHSPQVWPLVSHDMALRLVHSADPTACRVAASQLAPDELLDVLCTLGVSRQTACVAATVLCDVGRGRAIAQARWRMALPTIELLRLHGIAAAAELIAVMISDC